MKRKSNFSKKKCPGWLDATGQQTWARVTADMGNANDPFDAELLAVFCDCYSHLVKCSQALRSEGYSLPSESGLAKINPAVNALRGFQRMLTEIARRVFKNSKKEKKCERKTTR